MTWRRTLFLPILLTFSAITAQAQDGVSFTIHHLYQSPRALGMGDAFTAVANDYSALFYNPAGLARRDEGQVNLSINAGASPGIKTFVDEIDAIQNDPALDEPAKSTALYELIQSHYGDTYGLRLAPLEGMWVRPKWGIGFVPADISVEITPHRHVGPSIDTTIYADSYLVFGYGDDIKSVDYGRLSWGVSGKFVNRGWASLAIEATELAANSQVISEDDLLEGYTVDADVGFLWTPDLPSEGFWSWLTLTRPTVGLVVHNIAETGFGQTMNLINKEKTEAPEKLYRVVDVGTRWEYPSMWVFGGRGTLDVRDIGHPNFNWRRGLHLGLEYDWSMYTWWKGHYRVGLNQGFWTAGLSAELGIFNLDFVSYAEDVGTYSTPVESRQYAVKLNLDF
jgi:hypothetical protein